MLVGRLLLSSPCYAAPNWSVSFQNTVTLDTSASGLAVTGMSGVLYQGPSTVVGKHRFVTVLDNSNQLITFDAAFDLTGNLVSAEAISLQTLSVGGDLEGIAQVGSSIYVSDEFGPRVRQFDATTGGYLADATIPPVFTNHVANTRGFESLAYNPTGNNLWTANEEALTVDGSRATSSAGTTVRLLELDLAGGTLTPGRQLAYEVDPIHTSNGANRSGLSELVHMPDGSLLALERSAAATFLPPAFQNRLYEIDDSSADDISAATFDAGLIGQSYVPVSKDLLLSGAVGGLFGQNLEGLAVGPRLPNGDWILLGVVDDGGSSDPLSGNTIVAFVANPIASLPAELVTSDFDQDADVDGADFLAWQRGFGVSTLAGVNHGDGNHDGQVDDADLDLWKARVIDAAPQPAVATVPEPSVWALLFLAGASGLAHRRIRQS